MISTYHLTWHCENVSRQRIKAGEKTFFGNLSLTPLITLLNNTTMTNAPRVVLIARKGGCTIPKNCPNRIIVKKT